jgi:squalene-hopene/tetraprenyl-beta-curcumene cyclase
MGLGELIVDGETGPAFSRRPAGGGRFFLAVDRLLKAYNEAPIAPLRERAIRRAERWLLDHVAGSEGLGAIFPPMVYILIVYRILGYPEDHPRVVEAHRQLRELMIREGDSIRIQPCHSPVWDTGIAMHALAEAELEPGSREAAAASRWLLGKECRAGSDWTVNTRPVEPSGWFFEYENPHYPDTDDTAMAVMSLRRLGGAAAEPAVQRGVAWLLAMQNDDGGWAAFDRTKDRPILERIPFADHNAMQDPSCPDITGRVLEGLGHCGLDVRHPAVARAVAFIRSRQEKEGCWFGRWGVNYIYGTWQVLVGLRSVGHPTGAEFVRRAAAWLRSCQKPDGSWGEGCETYEDPSLKGKGESTPSQTAWGMMGLMAAGAGREDGAVRRAALWLAERQRADGDWDEEPFTGTGFPRVFYLRYHLYRLYFPLMALGRYGRLPRG